MAQAVELLAFGGDLPLRGRADESPENAELTFSFDFDTSSDWFIGDQNLPACLLHVDSFCDCFHSDLLALTDQNHGAIEELPPLTQDQHAPNNSNIAERIRDTRNNYTMEQVAVPELKLENSAPIQNAPAAIVDGAVVAEQEQEQPLREAGVDLKQEQRQEDAPSSQNEQQKESAQSPEGHNDTKLDYQILPLAELVLNTAAEAPIEDQIQHTDLLVNANPISFASQLNSQVLPTSGSFNAGPSNGLDSSQTVLPEHNTYSDQIMDGTMSHSLLPAVDFPLAGQNSTYDQAASEFMESYEPPAPQLPPATGFAKLEFLDGHFYMTTYAVELGRDMRAFRVAQHQTARKQIMEENMAKPRSKRSSSLPGTPARPIKIDGGASVARSFLSESGGIVGEDDGHISLKKRRKKSQKSRSTETSSSRSHLSRKNSTTHLQSEQNHSHHDEHEQTTVDPNVTAPLDPLVHMPDPHFTPLIPIHPPKSEDEPHPTGKGISRKHVRIAYNFERSYFEMTVFGRNGAFHDDDHYEMGDIVALHDGSQIQIGGVFIKFVLPNVSMSEADEDLGSVSGRMSFSFEDTRGASIVADDESVVESLKSADEDLVENGYWDENTWDVDDMDEDEDEEDEEDEEEDESPKAARQKLTIKAPPPKAQKHVRKPSVSKPSKTATKLKLKLSSKQKAKAKAKAEAEAREQERRELKAKNKAKQAKIEAREAAKEKTKAQQAKEAMKEPAKNPKEASKEPSKTPIVDETKAPKEPAAPRIARDAPMQNGDQVTIPGLPVGVTIPPRKKGPGRPPKDGVMSKRERALLIKQNKEREKAIKLGLDPSQIPPPELKPPKPRPRKNSQGEDIDADGQDQDGEDKKSTKAPRPPRSPSPEMRIEDYTEEQLQRPQPNYVYLIYEAIQNCKSGVMNLQQIYSAIERRYPYFKFRTTSNGWQSSVRHNLGQHEAFRKVEKEGKGWLWGIKEGVPIERERKKKTPPPQSAPTGYGQQYPYPQYGGYAPQPGAAPYPPAYPPQRLPATSMVPPSLQQQAVKPPPSLAQPTGAPGAPLTQSYSSPYAKDTNKPGEAPSPQSQPSRPPGPYQQHGPPGPYSGPSPYQSAYRPHPPPQQHGASGPSAGPSGQTHHNGPPIQRRYRPPAQDVINTFKEVFVATYSSRDNIGPAKAEAIVSNAIKRVLEPESMVNVPADPDEEGVSKAFESILVKSQGPPRQATPSQPPATQAPPIATSTVANAALTAAATAGATGPQVGSGSNTPAGSGPASAVKPQSRSHTPIAPPTSAAQPQPQRPAEANLIGMLMGGAPAARATSGTPPTGSKTTAPPTAASATSASTSNISATAPRVVPTADMLGLSQKLNGIVARANGTATPTRPAVEPLTPPPGAAMPTAHMVPKRVTKRSLSPQIEVQEGKKAKVEGG